MNNRKIILMILFMWALVSCEEEWLEVRRDKKQVVPQTIGDFQALLDNASAMNNWTTPSFGEISSDDFYVTDEVWNNLTSIGGLQQKHVYSWGDDIFDSEYSTGGWDSPYRIVFYSNVVLEGVDNIEPAGPPLAKLNNVKGSAYFFRAWAFFQVAQVFGKPYNAATASSDLGIPLRLESDVNVPSVRASVKETYELIISDLKAAIPLLPDLPLEKTRPSKSSAYGLLAKVYLQMEMYEEALAAANESLAKYDALIDYNTLDTEANYPFDKFNEETMFYSTMQDAGAGILLESKIIVDPELYSFYEEDDLRKAAFYYDDAGVVRYKGSYSGSDFFGMYMFSGIATDEIYLIKAECLARLVDTAGALATLNDLLLNRYITGSFIPLTASNAEDALELILKERRKELVFRGIRWSDLRRLNRDPRFATTLTRTIDGVTYTLEPGDVRYTLPIPQLVIDFTGMKQNER